jgi:tRNA(Ile)-lysidine synthase
LVIELFQRVEAAIDARRLFPARQEILVAVSGGLDSMVLLDVLRRLAVVRHWRLTAAHFNHHLRGRSSDADERLVRATCRKQGIPCIVSRADVKQIAVSRGVSVEMAAREARHGFLAKVARERGIRAIALAHHADDQVELFFLRLLRGAGTDGLAGMKWSNPSPSDKQLRLVRPMLEMTKADLLAFAASQKVLFREDTSNASLDILRNRVRHELLPLLKKSYQPALTRVIQRDMEILGAESEFLNELAGEWAGGKSSLTFGNLAVPIQRRVLQRELYTLGVEAEFDLIERLRTAPACPVTVGSVLAVRHDGQGKVHRIQLKPERFEDGLVGVDFVGKGGCGRFGEVEWCWQIHQSRTTGLPKFSNGREWFDADKVGPMVVLRHWRPGDRFQPVGLARPVKLQDLFVNAKVPRFDRHLRIVATTEVGEIWWVEGLRIAEQFKLCPETRRRLEWRWRRSESR